MIGGGKGRSAGAGAATGACVTAGAFADPGRIFGQRLFGLLMDAGRLGRTRSAIAVGAQAFDRGARQIVGIAAFLRRSGRRCNGGGFDRSGRGGHRDRSGRRSHRGRCGRRLNGLDGRRQYYPDLFSLRFCRLGFCRLRIGGLGIGRLGIDGLCVSRLAVCFILRLCISLAMGLLGHRRTLGRGLLHDRLLGNTLGLDARSRNIADAGCGFGWLRFGFGFRLAVPFGIGGRCRCGRRRVGAGLGHDIVVDDVRPDDRCGHRREDVDRKFLQVIQHSGHSPRPTNCRNFEAH